MPPNPPDATGHAGEAGVVRDKRQITGERLAGDESVEWANRLSPARWRCPGVRRAETGGRQFRVFRFWPTGSFAGLHTPTRGRCRILRRMLSTRIAATTFAVVAHEGCTHIVSRR